MNILIIQTTDSGVYYHRQRAPHIVWHESGDEFKEDSVVIVETSHREKLMDIVNNNHFDIVQFSVAVSGFEHIPHFVDFMKRRGSKIVLDIDDKYHKRKDVKSSIKIADAITTVSDHLAQYYMKYGAKRYPHVIENGVDSQERQFETYPVANDKPIFGYLGSTRHEDDLRMMDYNFHSREVLTVCEEYYKLLDLNHYTSLKHWSDYAWEYNAIDVALAPLQDNSFNNSKSFLKVIEAGFKKKAIICSDIEPYNRKIHSEFRDVIDFIPLGTSWKDRIESYTLEEAHQRGEELYKLVQPFELRNLNKKRREIYEQIIKAPRR
jgi:hypothetical protein